MDIYAEGHGATFVTSICISRLSVCKQYEYLPSVINFLDYRSFVAIIKCITNSRHPQCLRVVA